MDGYIYVTGGRFRGRTLGSAERLCLSSLAWEPVPRMAENRGSHGAAAVGQSLLVLGGGGFKSNLSTVERLEPEGCEWRFVAPMTTHRHALAVQSFEHAVYAIGGWVDGSACSDAVEKYDALTDAWTRCGSLIFARRLHGATAVAKSRRIYAFGGNCSDGEWYTSTVEAYNVDSDEWVRRNDLPCAGPCSAVTVRSEHDETVFVFMHGGHVLRYNEELDEYTRLARLPLVEWFCFAAVAVGAHVYCVGGAERGKWSKAVQRYDTLHDTWECMPSMLKYVPLVL